MQDPHVVWLRYDLQTDETVSFKDPAPVQYENEKFLLQLEQGRLTANLKEHFSSISDAKSAVESFLRGWEMDAELQYRGGFKFVYDDASVIDRNPPPPGTKSYVAFGSGQITISSSCCVKAHVVRGSYPAPPERFRWSSDVDSLWQRYLGYLDGREPLQSMAYFCLTLIEKKAGGRAKAAKQLAIEKDILDKIANIATNHGDLLTVRKIDKKNDLQPLKEEDTPWVEVAIRALIRRLGEYDPSAPLPLVTMADLPKLHTEKRAARKLPDV